MNPTELLDLWRSALWTAATVAGPFLAVSLVVGLAVAVFQAATQLQENVLSFVPKLIAVGLLMLATGHWMLGELVRYGHSAAHAMVEVGRHGRR
ncbi:MAG: flagellar biosynthetic protein FliQ [Myxococcota bacterium]